MQKTPQHPENPETSDEEAAVREESGEAESGGELLVDETATREYSQQNLRGERDGDDDEVRLGDMNGVPDAQNDPREQLSHYKQQAQRHPRSARHLAELAEGYAAADLPHKALRQYQRALELSREQGEEDTPDAHLGIGDLCRTFAMSAAAVRSYERAVRLSPKRPFYRWKLAVALAVLGLYDQAETQMRTAVELAPSDSYYRFQLADVLLLMERDDEAIQMLRDVVALAPRDDYYQLRLGAALLRQNRSEEALPHFERAVQLKPKNASYHTLLRYAHTRDGREPAISVDVEMVELDAYDEDFVRRIQRMAVAE